MEGQSITNRTEKEIATNDSSPGFNVQGLWPDFRFTITVAAVTKKGVGDTSEVVEATTHVDGKLCIVLYFYFFIFCLHCNNKLLCHPFLAENQHKQHQLSH